MGRGGEEESYHQKLLGKLQVKKKSAYNLNKIKEERRVQHWGDANPGNTPHPSQTCSPPQEHSTRLFRHCYSPSKSLYVEQKPTFMITTEFYNCSFISQQKTGKKC